MFFCCFAGTLVRGVLVKLLGKMVGITALGMAVALVLYPALHEAGHALAALLTGATVKEIHVLPLPYVVCDLADVTQQGRILISLAGVLFPAALSLLSCRWFWGWYLSLLVKITALVALVLSVVSVVCFAGGVPLPSDDMTQLLQWWPEGIAVCFWGLSAVATLLLIQIVREQPFRRCACFFGV